MNGQEALRKWAQDADVERVINLISAGSPSWLAAAEDEFLRVQTPLGFGTLADLWMGPADFPSKFAEAQVDPLDAPSLKESRELLSASHLCAAALPVWGVPVLSGPHLVRVTLRGFTDGDTAADVHRVTEIITAVQLAVQTPTYATRTVWSRAANHDPRSLAWG